MALPDETARDGSSETTAPPAVQAFDGSEPCASVGPAACDAGDIRCQTADSESETTRFAVAGEDPDDSASDDLRLIPGAFVGDGRYRLLLWHGGLEHLQFWQALDTTLHRQVALTLVDPDGRLPDEQIQAIVSRTLSLSRLDMPGIGTGAAGGPRRARGNRGRGVDPRRHAGRSRRHQPAAGRRRTRDAVAGRRRRGGAPGRDCVVDRPPQPGARQHRRPCGAGIPGDHARRHRGGRPARHRRLPLRAAGRPLAAPPVRGAQRSGPRAGRDRSPAERPHGHRRRYSFPNLGRRDGLVAGVRRDPQRHNASEHAGAGHRRSRSGRMRHPRAEGLPCAAAPLPCARAAAGRWRRFVALTGAR